MFVFGQFRNNAMPDKTGHVLIIDDDLDVLTAAQLLLKRHYALIQIADDPGQLPALLEQQSWDVILLNMNVGPGANSSEEGLHWLACIHQHQPDTQVNLMTAYGAVDTAVKALEQGAIDFVLKP